jgi:hypothetical protein
MAAQWPAVRPLLLRNPQEGLLDAKITMEMLK